MIIVYQRIDLAIEKLKDNMSKRWAKHCGSTVGLVTISATDFQLLL